MVAFFYTHIMCIINSFYFKLICYFFNNLIYLDYLYKNTAMARKKTLEENEKKQRLNVAISPILMDAIKDNKNKSKYVERLIYMDLVNNNILENNIIL